MYIQGRRIYFYLQVFFVIPKTPANTSWWKDRCGGKCEGTCDPTRYWRLCFHPWERLIISRGQRTECVKPVIRLLKVQGPNLAANYNTKKDAKKDIRIFLKFQNFRDCHNPILFGISSYALKSVVMNMILERPSKIWNRAKIQEHFLEVYYLDS